MSDHDERDEVDIAVLGTVLLDPVLLDPVLLDPVLLDPVLLDTVLLDTVLLDVDGTLTDSTYQHAVAWHRAFAGHDLSIPMWHLHRAIGMGGDRLVTEVAGEDVESRLGDDLREAQRQQYEVLSSPRSAPSGTRVTCWSNCMSGAGSSRSRRRANRSTRRLRSNWWGARAHWMVGPAPRMRMPRNRLLTS